MNTKKYDIEDRLISFSVFTLKITDSLYETRAGNHIAGQVVRSCTSPALYYGEAQSAESNKDFIHKLKVVLKELRETFCGLKLIKMAELTNKKEKVDQALDECNQLIAIFVKSIDTAQNGKSGRK